MRKPYLPRFREEFYDKLLKPAGNNPVRDRASSLDKIFSILDTFESERIQIVETGTMRPDHGELCFGDDGCSTFIFNDYAKRNTNLVFVWSIDINETNVDYARTKAENVRVLCSDSVAKLNHISRTFPSAEWDLIYLDSFDVTRDNPHPSALHHLCELCAAMPMVRRSAPGKEDGTILCVDDADAFFDGGKTGKAMYVRKFMDMICAKKIHDGYQLVYQF